MVAVLALLAVVACSDSAQWQGTIEERDGVAWINNPAADPGPEGAEPPFALELEQTFGAEEEPADSLLSFITGMAVDEAGNVYVVDRGDDRLVAFAPDGKLLWAGGRSGQGPGEFDGPTWISWDGGSLPKYRLILA